MKDNTKKETIMKKLEEYKTIVENEGHTVLYIAVKGSQNYNLATPNSDIDAIAIVKPHKYKNKPISYKISTTNSNEDEIQVQDLLSFTNSLYKGNCVTIEVLNSPYSIGELPPIFYQVEENIQSQYYMLVQKYKALDHPYPSKLKLIEQYGYDPKQLHHIVRLHRILREQYETGTYNRFYEPGEYQEYLISLKNNPTLTLTEAKELAEKLMKDGEYLNKKLEEIKSAKEIKESNYKLKLEAQALKYLYDLDEKEILNKVNNQFKKLIRI